MSNETVLTLVGNLTADPELRYTQNGHAVANLTVASTPRVFDRTSNEWRDGETAFLRCTVWGGYAEKVCKSLTKGMRVIVQGALGQRGYETKEGEKRTTFEVEVYEIGPVLRYARAEVHRVVQDADSVAPGSGRRAAAKTPQPAGADAPF